MDMGQFSGNYAPKVERMDPAAKMGTPSSVHLLFPGLNQPLNFRGELVSNKTKHLQVG